MRMTRRGDEITFQSQRDGDHSSQAVFQARYRPTGEPYQAASGTLEAH
jgi:uncharacterized protein YqjF (DUF2071 family)